MPEEIAKRLADEIIFCGYQVRSESEVGELRDAIKQGEVMIMTTDTKKLVALYNVLDGLVEKIFSSSDALMIAIFYAAITLQNNIINALDELNGELHLERLPE